LTSFVRFFADLDFAAVAQVIKLKTGNGAARRVAVTACTYSPDASMIVGGAFRIQWKFGANRAARLGGGDGSIQIWNAKAAKYQRPEKHVRVTVRSPFGQTRTLIVSFAGCRRSRVRH
jgi:hypothetical protein